MRRRGFTLVELLVAATIIAILIALVLSCVGCENIQRPGTPVSASGVQKAQVKIDVGSDGLTVEQRNVQRRLKIDNDLGALKHLYVISAYSGQVLIYSTVKGKVSSSGKRLTPVTVAAGRTGNGSGTTGYGLGVTIGNEVLLTGEVLQDDGTYGSSVDYVFWFDEKDVYHQHYVQGGQILHVANQPQSFGSVQMEVRKLEDK